jgi:hypothetical protein
MGTLPDFLEGIAIDVTTFETNYVLEELSAVDLQQVQRPKFRSVINYDRNIAKHIAFSYRLEALNRVPFAIPVQYGYRY